jgi:hypothetical protein
VWAREKFHESVTHSDDAGTFGAVALSVRATMNVSPVRPNANGNQAAAPRAGRMTSVMRAITLTNAPRVPRVAVVHRGKIVEERLIRQRTSVTIGSAESAMFVVANAPLPGTFQLLELVGNDYWLRFTDHMAGRVALATGPMDLAALKSVSQVVNGCYRVKLTDDARGKIVVGDTTFLFQIVPCPPAQSRPKLPLGVMTNAAGRIDWSLTIVAAFSFLIHFGIVGAAYSDWMDPVVDTDRAVAGVIDMSKRLDSVPIEDKSKPDPNTTKPDPNTTKPDTTKPVANNTTPHNTTTNNTRPSNSHNNSTTSTTSSVSDAEAARLASRANEMGMDILGAKNSGPAVQNVLDRNNVPAVDLSNAAAQNSAISTKPDNGLKTGPGGPVASKSNGLPGIAGDRTKSNSSTTAGPENNVPPPPVIIDTVQPVPSATVSDADRVIASLRPRFRKCYQDGLNGDPTMQGRTVLVASVGPNGEVKSVSVAESQGLSPGVNACLSRALNNAQFATNSGGANLKVPISFHQQTRQ